MSEDSDTTVEYRMEDTAAVEPPAPAEASERSPEAEYHPTTETPDPPRRRRRRRRRRRNGATSSSGATSGPPGRGPRGPPPPPPTAGGGGHGEQKFGTLNVLFIYLLLLYRYKIINIYCKNVTI